MRLHPVPRGPDPSKEPHAFPREAGEVELLVLRSRTTAQQAVTKILAQAGSIDEAARGIVTALGTELGWPLAAIWLARHDGDRLRCAASFCADPARFESILLATQQVGFSRGEGVIGRVWATGESMWTESFPSAAVPERGVPAWRDGIRTALACPIVIGGSVLGVIEILSPEAVCRDEDLVGVLEAFGSQLGQLVERVQAEDALRVARQAAEQASRAKTDFLANVSHEIRTPLNAILGVGDILWETDLDDEQREYMSLFRRAGANLLTLVNDLLDLSRAEQSRAERARTAAAGRETPASRARALDILLVEDHPDNRLIVLGYLKRTPHRLTIAENGEEAVAAFKTGTFHIVLMDMQMPVMDGYEATRRIRAWEREQGREPTPIVALTAHALPEEVARTKEAGCDAHLDKPVVKATLLAALEAHAAQEASSPREDAALLAAIDPDLLDLVPGYLQNRFRDIALCREHLAASRFEELRVIAHGMAGSGGAYGFDEITRIGRTLQAAARGRDAVSCARSLDELDAHVRRIHAAFGH